MFNQGMVIQNISISQAPWPHEIQWHDILQLQIFVHDAFGVAIRDTCSVLQDLASSAPPEASIGLKSETNLEHVPNSLERTHPPKKKVGKHDFFFTVYETKHENS